MFVLEGPAPCLAETVALDERKALTVPPAGNSGEALSWPVSEGRLAGCLSQRSAYRTHAPLTAAVVGLHGNRPPGVSSQKR